MAIRKPNKGSNVDGRGHKENSTTIRSRILRRILPVALVPILVLGAFGLAGVVEIQRQTSHAVSSAEEILTKQVVEDTAARSSERAARELADYVDQWLARVQRQNDDLDFRESVVQISNATQQAGFGEMSSQELTAALMGDSTSTTNALASTLENELRTVEDDVQVLLVSEQGINLGSTSDQTLDDYSESRWFQRTISTGSGFRSFVNDGEGPPAFEIALRTEPPPDTSGAGVLRVRVPLSNAQQMLDKVAGDDAVEAVLIDNTYAVLVADTSTDHDPIHLYDRSALLTSGSGANVTLLGPGVVQDDANVTSARQVADRMGNPDDLRFDWLVQTSQPIDIASSSLSEIQEVAREVSQLRQLLIIGVVALLLAALMLTVLAVRSAASRITRPVDILARQAQEAAAAGIPSIVEAARTSDRLPVLPKFDAATNDELSILANSMNTMQEAAVDLAAGQAKLRRQNVARTFVSLGRRNQNLLNRQLEFIDELERQETDADALENLFRLDHLATRMRRNAENLLVLAGEQTPRRWAKPIAIRDVLRAAAAEIADYRRVRIGEIEDATVSGNLATDLSHLIAELLENAGSFSPPNAPIEVLGQATTTHYRLAIVDQGIGMDPKALAQVNDRLQNPVDFADAPSAYLGLFVVGRLSQELGITVRLASADPSGEGRRRGTIAFIDLPITLLSNAAATPIEIYERSVDGVAQRASASSHDQDLPTTASSPVSEDFSTQPSPSGQAQHGRPVVTTAAGFPKRTRRQDPDTEAPDVTTSAVASPSLGAAAAPPSRVPATEITAAGFPKRSSAKRPSPSTPSPTPASRPTESPAATPKRDAERVSQSLRSIREAVTRARATTVAEADAPAQEPQPVPDSSSVPPPGVPMTPPGGAAPIPEASGPIIDHAAQPPISDQPIQDGSES